MISRDEVLANLGRYNKKEARIGVLGSHSALDTCDGAYEEGFKTLAVCQKGREKTFNNYFRSYNDSKGNHLCGFVDDTLIVDKFVDVMKPENQQYLMDTNTLWVPNRSFTSYVDIDAVENDWKVPMVGSRDLLRSEERGEVRDYYWILEQANLPFPKKINKPEDIDGLTIIKVHHAQKKLERGFFTAKSYEQYVETSQEPIKQGLLAEDFEPHARMEQYV
ncbi:MAG: DUF1246 domain-containing protein, partial [archaeon]|nr:DUF1246 domain-containing protein [archaeon]